MKVKCASLEETDKVSTGPKTNYHGPISSHV
ncbi:hypothetical protein J2Z26_003426 [Bacillus luteolus]|nr:hypothetical protein [Cytobacillus luteolus]